MLFFHSIEIFKINCGRKRAKGKRKDSQLIWKCFQIIPYRSCSYYII